MKYRDENGIFHDLYLPPTGDTLPIGAEVDYDGEEVPYGWEEVEEPKDIYSTDEVKTNKVWIDGKPIYRKVLVTTSGVTSSTYINIDTTNIDNLWIDPSHSFQKVVVGGDNFVGNLPIPMYQSTNNFITVLPNMNQSRITINVGTGAYCHGRCTITTLYTKTTDQGGNS